MKKKILVVAALALCFSMAACGKDKTETTTATTTEALDADDTESDESSGYAKAPAGVQEYNIVGKEQFLGSYSIDLIIGEDYEHYYKLDVEDSELGDAIGEFRDHFSIKTDASSGKLGEYELIDSKGNSLGQLSAKEIRELFDPTLKYEVVDWSYSGEVKLSELEENKLYKAPLGEEAPSFVNDTDKDYIVWVMDEFDYSEKPYAYVKKEIEGIGAEDKHIGSFGDNIYVRLEELTVDKLTPEDDELTAAFVNGVNSGEEVEIGVASILANAGDSDVDVEVTTFDDKTVSLTVKAGEIYNLNWMTVSRITVK